MSELSQTGGTRAQADSRSRKTKRRGVFFSLFVAFVLENSTIYPYRCQAGPLRIDPTNLDSTPSHTLMEALA